MPIKTDSSVGLFDLPSSTCFDCDELKSNDDITSDICNDTCNAPCDDIWKKFDDFLLTPPQSPPIKFELVSDVVDGTCDSVITNFYHHNTDVLHDCMWSGTCIEDTSNHTFHNHTANCSNYIKICSKSHNRPETPINVFSTSPFTISSSFTSLNDLYENSSNESQSFDDDDDDDDEDNDSDYMRYHTPLTPVSSPSCVKKSLINDHSYDGFNVSQKHHQKSSRYGSKSLIYPSSKKADKHIRTRIKCQKINGGRIKVIKADSVHSPTIKVEKLPMVKVSKSPNAKTRNTIIAQTKVEPISSPAKHNQKEPSFKYPKRRKTNSGYEKCGNVMPEKNICIEMVPHEQPLDSDDDKLKPVPPVKRREHNDSERKRRDHLRNAFLDLKDQVPNLKSNDKRPPRILILSEATSYVNLLNEKQQYLEKTLQAELQKKEKLLKQLSVLRLPKKNHIIKSIIRK